MTEELKPIDVSKYTVTESGNVIRTDNNDKDKIKFAIRYLKQGLKSKRTPPLYERLMNELGFECIGKENLELEKENAELRKVAGFQQSGNMSRYFELKKRDDQLDKAKELLTRLSTCFSSYAENIFEIELVKQAEDFIKEIEND